MHDLSRRPLTKAEVEAPETLPEAARIYFRDNLTSQSVGRDKGEGAASWFGVTYEGRVIKPSMSVRWKTNEKGFERLLKSHRVEASTGNNLGYIRFLEDYPVFELTDIWTDTLKAEINAEAWESLNSDTSRPFGKPVSGRIAVKVINHLGDEVMKVFKVA